MRLDRFSNPDFERGRPRWVEALWLCASGLLFSSWLPGSAWRCSLLRLFGARVGNDVVIKPRVRVKFPWKLTVGEYSWIGEGVWIDNLDEVSIGAHCCLSQAAFLCTGSHRWDLESFDLFTRPIVVEDQCWLAAGVSVGPGSHIRRGAVLSMGLRAQGEYDEDTVYQLDGGRVTSRPRYQGPDRIQEQRDLSRKRMRVL